MPIRGNAPNLLSLFLFLAVSDLSILAAAHFVPSVNHLLACGAASDVTLPDHRLFVSDDNHLHGHRLSTSLSNPSPSTSYPFHRTARIFSSRSCYRFSLSPSSSHVILRLHFYPFSTSQFDLSYSIFHVTANRFALLSNFSTSTSILKEFLIPSDSDHLAICFIPSNPSTFAFINAIEVISAPEDLLVETASLVQPSGVVKFYNLPNQAFETIYRINVGGPKVTPFNDTLWRTWAAEDDKFLRHDSAVAESVHFVGRIEYRGKGWASREVAPDNVYGSARVLRNKNSNLTWVLPVKGGHRYLVRVHFCDIASLALNELYFNIYLNGNVGYDDFDISETVGYLASPYYVDFVVDVDDFGMLSLAIGSSKKNRSWSKLHWLHGLLNGLEIFKMNKTVEGIDGGLPDAVSMDGSLKWALCEFVHSVTCWLAVMSLIVLLFMLTMKLRDELRARAGWSRLPVEIPNQKVVSMYPISSTKLEL